MTRQESVFRHDNSDRENWRRFSAKKTFAHERGACTEAGLEGLHFHDFRRSAIRNMECAGIPRHVAMSISGHRTEAVYRRYDIVVEADLKDAADTLTQFHRQQPKLRRVK